MWLGKIRDANLWGDDVSAIDIIDLALSALAAQTPDVIRETTDGVLEPSLIAVDAEVSARMRSDIEQMRAGNPAMTERAMWARMREVYFDLIVRETDAASVAAQKMRLTRAVFRDWVKALSRTDTVAN